MKNYDENEKFCSLLKNRKEIMKKGRWLYETAAKRLT
jgi:hypothetical protein